MTDPPIPDACRALGYEFRPGFPDAPHPDPAFFHVVELDADGAIQRYTGGYEREHLTEQRSRPLSAAHFFAHALLTETVFAPGPRPGHTYQYQPGSHDRPVDEPYHDDDPTLGARLHVVERDGSDHLTRYTDPFDEADMLDVYGTRLDARDAFSAMSSSGHLHPAHAAPSYPAAPTVAPGSSEPQLADLRAACLALHALADWQTARLATLTARPLTDRNAAETCSRRAEHRCIAAAARLLSVIIRNEESYHRAAKTRGPQPAPGRAAAAALAADTESKGTLP